MSEFQWSRVSERCFLAGVMLAVVALGLLGYAPTFRNGFVWDDASSVLVNPHVQDRSFFVQLFQEDQHPFGRGQGNFYRPLVAVSFLLDFLLSGGVPSAPALGQATAAVSPFLFHATNMAWHIAAALLLLAVLRRFRAPRFVCVAAPLLWVAHPLHTEAVAYISGRADSMSAVFMLAALWFACWEQTTARRVAGVVLGTVSYACGLMSKEAAFILPVLLALALATLPSEQPPGRDRAPWIGRLTVLGVAVAVLAVYAGLRMTVLHFGTSPAPDIPLGRRCIELCQSFALYVRLMLVPTGLHMERSLEDATVWTALAGAVLLAALAALTGLGIMLRRWRAVLGLAWFLVAWFPISGFFPLNAPMAEHWMYLPMAGLLWGLAEWVEPFSRKGLGKRVLPLVVFAGCAVFVVLTAARNLDWRDNETIFQSTLAQNPTSARVHFNLAVTYEDLLKNPPAARRHYAAVLDLYRAKKGPLAGTGGTEPIWDEELEAHLSLGRLFMEEKAFGPALEHFGKAARVIPNPAQKPLVAQAALGAGQCCWVLNDPARAAAFFKQAVALEPGLAPHIERGARDGATHGGGR